MNSINELRYLNKLYQLRSLGFSYINPTIRTDGVKSSLGSLLPNDLNAFKRGD